MGEGEDETAKTQKKVHRDIAMDRHSARELQEDTDMVCHDHQRRDPPQPIQCHKATFRVFGGPDRLHIHSPSAYPD